jgi:ribosomal-protein-alanine N-acetyltransferase
MNAVAAATDFDFAPMIDADLDEVMQIEAAQYPFPWTRGNFSDSLRAGYCARVLRDAGVRLIAYAVQMIAVDEVHLLNLTVARGSERLGHGWRMLDRMAGCARSLAARSMLLEVRPSNEDALRLYRRYGFEAVGLRPAYYPAHSGREDAIIMRIAL